MVRSRSRHHSCWQDVLSLLIWRVAVVAIGWCSWSSNVRVAPLLPTSHAADTAAFVPTKQRLLSLSPLSHRCGIAVTVAASVSPKLNAGTPTAATAIQLLQRTQRTRTASCTTTSLYAIGALVKRAKLAEIEQTYVQQESTLDDSIQSLYARIQEQAPKMDLSAQSPGPLQQALTRRAGTLTVIAEYKRKLSTVATPAAAAAATPTSTTNGYSDWLVPELLSPVFREYGASGIAVLADARMGGCTYADLAAFATEQSRAKNNVPGSVLVINSDVILDAWQVAHSAALGAAAVVLPYELLLMPSLSPVSSSDSIEQPVPVVDSRTLSPLAHLLRAAAAVNLEAIVSVSTPAQAQAAIDLGARMLLVNVDGIDEKVACIANLVVPTNQQVCKIAYILAKNDKSLTEIEEAWAVRDQGFQCAWVCEALYKNAGAGSASAAASEHPGAIIKAMRNKSSLKFASPKAQSGRGEGAREYLGDILM
jgi:indole-3-glycerol phosphate synthase